MPYSSYTLYIILVLPAIIFSLIAQASVKSTYAKYSKVLSRRGLTGCDIAQNILGNNGINDVAVTHISGNLTDHYSPKEKVIRLSDGVYSSSSVAALGIAAHEAGHTCQHYQNYVFIKIRNAVLPVAQFGSSAAMPLVLIGLIFNFGILIDIGVYFFMAVVLFQLITLPVEFNASHRAIKTLQEYNYLDDDELRGTKKVLTAAAMTYVASLAVSLMQLIRLMAMASRRRN